MKDGLVIEAGGMKPVMVVLPDFGGVLRQLYDIIEHDPLLVSYRSGGVVLLQGFDEFFVEGHSTQKLCVGLDSIDAPVGHRDHGSDHLVLAALKRQIG